MNVSLSSQEIRDVLMEVIRNEFKNGLGASLSATNAATELQGELEQTKLLLDERTTELNDFKEKFQESLQNIDSKCSKTTAELSLKNPSDREGPAVNNQTVRDLLEEMTKEMKHMKEELRIIKNSPACCNADYSEEDQAPDIRSKTHREEMQLVREEFESAVADLPPPVDGVTLGGKTVAEISALVPLIPGNQVTLTVEIVNRLNLPLTNLQVYVHSGDIYEKVPSTVKEGTREVANFRGGAPTVNNVPSGAIAYRIGLTGFQILLHYFNNRLKRSVIGIGLTLAELPVKKYFDTSSWGCGTLMDFMRPDKNFLSIETEQVTTTIVKLQNLRAKITITPSARAVWSVEIISVRPENNPRHYLINNEFSSKRVKNGATVGQRCISELLASISTPYCCIVEISNNLGVPLENPAKYFLDQQPLERISPVTKEVMIFKSDTKVDGLFTYSIATTDLRLAVAMRCQESGNSFAFGFIPSNVNAHQRLLDTLLDASHWITRPERHLALANDGQQVVQIRNIVAKAAMASEPKALLKIYVTTL